jgi:hypothetical protein
VLSLALVEQRLNQLLCEVDSVRDLRLAGAHDALSLSATVTWQRRRSRVGLDLAEIRLRHRHLGFRLRRIRVLGGLPVPRRVVAALLSRLRLDLVRVIPRESIVVVDLRRWIPREVDLQVITVQSTERYLHLWLGPGELRDLPPLLAPGPEEEQVRALTAGGIEPTP